MVIFVLPYSGQKPGVRQLEWTSIGSCRRDGGPFGAKDVEAKVGQGKTAFFVRLRRCPAKIEANNGIHENTVNRICIGDAGHKHTPRKTDLRGGQADA